MPDNQTLLIIIALALTLILTAVRARKRLSKVDHRMNRLRTVIREQSLAIRTMARETLALRRQDKHLENQIEELSGQCGDLKTRIAEAEKIDRRLYVLDDRKTPNDQTWVISLMHPNYKTHVLPEASPDLNMAWCTGRRYVVWAVDKDRALDKLNGRMPKEKGFVITGVAKIATEKERP
ncbi:MAG: hypothetical protein WCO00_02930 [Rhodospirillaceae bacterium]